jgi:hypothetical protein
VDALIHKQEEAGVADGSVGARRVAVLEANMGQLKKMSRII